MSRLIRELITFNPATLRVDPVIGALIFLIGVISGTAGGPPNP